VPLSTVDFAVTLRQCPSHFAYKQVSEASIKKRPYGLFVAARGLFKMKKCSEI